MEAATTSSATAAAIHPFLEDLTARGWRFKDDLDDEIRALIRDSKTAETLGSELLNFDLRSFGARSLPDSTALKKSSYVQGPKILQLVSIRDICLSNIDASLTRSQRHNRLLRFILTDGHNEVLAIEYSPIPSIPEDLIPGTKVCLQSRVPVHNGILCLNSKTVTVLGGSVHSLYEEWKIGQKYSGFSRATLRVSQNADDEGPPPFEKFKIDEHAYNLKHLLASHGSDVRQVAATKSSQIDKGWNIYDRKKDNAANDLNKESVPTRPEEKPSTSEVRPKEVSEAVPLQNQAAAQKLLQKMSQPRLGDKHSRGRIHRYKDNEDSAIFTLEEWEKRKNNSVMPLIAGKEQDVSRDEELARQLQHQLDLEDVNANPGNSEAEQIRLSMFSFSDSIDNKTSGKGDFRGRGRGKGRGKRRFH